VGVRGRYTESREGVREIASLYSWIYIALLEPGICQPAASRQNCQPAGNISRINWNFELCQIKNILPRFKHARCISTDTIPPSFVICYLHSYCLTDYGLEMPDGTFVGLDVSCCLSDWLILYPFIHSHSPSTT
jgi:hypothetical protein